MHPLISTIATIAAAQALDGSGDTTQATNLIGHVITGGGLIITSLAGAVAYLFKSLERRQEKALERQGSSHTALVTQVRGTLEHERTARAKLEQQLEETMGLITDLTAAIEQLSDEEKKRSNGA